MPDTTNDLVLLEQLVEMYCLFQVDPHDAEIAASQRDHGERTELMLACRKTKRRLAIVARSLRVKGPSLARKLEDGGGDSSVLLTLINRINDGPSSAAKALECAQALRVQMQRRVLRRGVAEDTAAVDTEELISPTEACKLYNRNASWWRNQAADGNLDAVLDGPNGSWRFTVAAASKLAESKKIGRRR